MNATLTVEIKKNDFAKIARELPDKVSIVTRKTAFDILNLSVPRTPVDTGFLRNSASVSWTDTQATIFWAAAYAIYQEFGTRYIAPKLFATSAVEEAKDGYIQAMQSLLRSLR